MAAAMSDDEQVIRKGRAERLTSLAHGWASKAYRNCVAAANNMRSGVAAAGRRWKRDLTMTIAVIADPARRSNAFFFKELPHELLLEAHSVRRMRNAIGLILLSTMSIIAIKSGKAFTLAGAASLGVHCFCGICMATLIWRLSVSKARRLTSSVHAWATEVQTDAGPWLAIEDDAAAIFAPWLPRRNTPLRTWSKKLKERIS